MLGRDRELKQTLYYLYALDGSLTILKELEAGKYTSDSIISYSYDRDGLPILTETAEDGDLLASYTGRADGLLEQTADGSKRRCGKKSFHGRKHRKSR